MTRADLRARLALVVAQIEHDAALITDADARDEMVAAAVADLEAAARRVAVDLRSARVSR